MKSSLTISEISAALSKTQAKLKNPSFDKTNTNPAFKNSKYASLAAIRDAIIPIASAEGLAVMQWLSSGEHSVRCETMISHSSGEWISETMDIPVLKLDAQGFASAATYAKRITLQAAFCVTGDEDDDGEAATKAKPDNKITAREGARERISEERRQEVDTLAGRVVDAFLAKDPDLAYAHYLDARVALTGNADGYTAFWDCFDSKQRRTLLDMKEAAAKDPATQG